MFLPVLFFKGFLFWIFSTALGAAAEADPIPMPKAAIDLRYQEILDTEREHLRRHEFVEDLASGLAALTIGLYGYYNDNRGISTKLIYSATQTAGVVMVSNTIKQLDRPSLMLSMDRVLRKRESIDHERYKKMVVNINERVDRSDLQQLTYTSFILGGIYGYNAYRERKIASLSHVFGFLSFSFLIVSGVSGIKLWSGKDLLISQGMVSGFHLALGPEPLVEWRLTI